MGQQHCRPHFGGCPAPVDGRDRHTKCQSIGGFGKRPNPTQVDHVDPSHRGNAEMLMGKVPTSVGDESNLTRIEGCQRRARPLVPVAAGRQFDGDEGPVLRVSCRVGAWPDHAEDRRSRRTASDNVHIVGRHPQMPRQALRSGDDFREVADERYDPGRRRCGNRYE